MILVAAPVLHAVASYFTKSQEQLVMIQVTQPITSPATRPKATQPKISAKIFLWWDSSLEIKMNSSGNEDLVRMQRQGMRTIVEQTSCFLSSLSTWLSWVISFPSVMKQVTTMHARIPIAGIASTKISWSICSIPLADSIELLPITKAAHVASAKDPKRSALMPATSPTLSPTLSAMVAGFLGLSSGRLDYTLPTRSEPKSAAFVQIPPPTLANNAMVDPPRPNPAIASNIYSKQFLSEDSSALAYLSLQTRITAMRTIMETETRVNPMTHPALKATLNALPSDYLASRVVLKLEQVAIFIPKAPQNMEVMAPVTKAMVVQQCSRWSTQKKTMKAIRTMKIEQTLYSERMNSLAPSWMMAPMPTGSQPSRKLWVYSPYFSERRLMLTSLIFLQLQIAHRRPTIPEKKTKGMTKPAMIQQSKIELKDIKQSKCKLVFIVAPNILR